MVPASSDGNDVLRRVRQGDEEALAAFFAERRERLRRLVEFRLDSGLRGRVDADDVLQDAFFDAVKRTRFFEGEDETSLFIWLRMVVQQTLADAHRRHLGAQRRAAGREAVRGRGTGTSLSLVANLVGQLTTPTLAARRAELAEQLDELLARMDPLDREVLALRHFEELSNSEVARELNIEQKAASIRYVRALRRLKKMLDSVPEFREAYGSGL